MRRAERIFISGAGGVIGKEMLIKIAAYPELQVLAADKKSEPESLASNIEYWQGDLNDMTINELRGFAPTVFIHLAATNEDLSGSLDFWDDNFDNNLKLSHHLIGLIKQLPSLKRIVFASSYQIYNQDLYKFKSPQNKPHRLSESTSIQPISLIGLAKLTQEKELDAVSHFYRDSFNSLSVRIFAGYGPGSLDIISRWVRELLLGEEITVCAPESIFDFIYAKDSAEGLLKLALQSDCAGVINLGSGQSRRVSDVVATLQDYFPDMNARFIECDALFEASEADVSRLATEVDWVPEYSLKRAIGEIIAYEKSKPNLNSKIETLNVLITSSAKKTPLIRAIRGVCKTLDPGIKVIAGDTNKHVVSRYVADHFWEMPIAEDSNLEQIINYCHQAQIGLIVPTRDGELEFWARHKDEFAHQGINVMISSFKTIQICLDKVKFYEFAKEFGFNTIYTTSDLSSLTSEGLFVVKERYGSGALNIGIRLDFEEAAQYSHKLMNPIFQPLIVGKEISADVWIFPDAFESIVLRFRTVVVGGESQVTQIFRNTIIEESLLNLAKKLEIVGAAVIQAIIDEHGIAHIIECNPRIGGASTASNAAGSNVFRKMIRHYLLGESIGPIGKFERIHEILQVRTAVDEYFYDFDI